MSDPTDLDTMWCTTGMASPETLSVQLPVRGRSVTVVGSTGRACSVIGALLDAGAKTTVVAARPPAYVSDLADRAMITLRPRDFSPADMEATELLFACTGRSETDRAIAELAGARGLFCIRTAEDRTADSAATPGIGKVFIVGGGPGDPGLLTVAGRAALARADVVVADRLAPLGTLNEVAPQAQIIDAAKIPGGRRTEQSEINAMLIEHALAGRTVVRLKGGDGFVFGRGGEEVDELVRAGIPVEVIPGVSAAIAAPAAALIPVTHRGLTQGFAVVSGHVPPDHPDCTVDYTALAHANTTIVLMMAVANLDAIARVLVDAGMSPATPAAVVADGTRAGQREIRAELATIAETAAAAGVRPPATVVIGAVAGFVAGRAVRPATARSAGLSSGT